MKKRIISAILALLISLSILPIGAWAAKQEALEDKNCIHVHDENCYSDGALPAEEAKEADLCDHVCTEQSGCVMPVETPEETAKTEMQSDGAQVDVAVEEVQTLIDSLPSVEAVEAMNDEELQAAYEYIRAVYDAYMSLSEEQRELIVGAAVFEDLLALFDDSTVEEGSLDVAVVSDAAAYGGELHFIIRHWHTKDDSSGSMFEDGSLQQSGDRYFVVVEGYIIPPQLSETGQYEFDLVDGSGQRVRVHNTTGVDGSIGDSNYVDYLNHDDGTIIFSTNTLYKDDKTEAEEFSSYSVSAGHSAVATNNKAGTLTIQYDPYIHLVKAHAFYVSATVDTDYGTDEIVIGQLGLFFDDEHDSVMVYTYKENVGTYKKGDIVKDANGQAITSIRDLPNGVNSNQVKLTKLYNSEAGLHTDKTASLNTAYYDDDRTFDLDLEAWYSEGNPPQIGLILDASFSMDAAIDTPNKITVSDEQIKKLKIRPLDSNPNATNDSWDRYFLNDAQINALLNKTNTDNSLLGVSGYTYYVGGNEGDYTPLGYWEGMVPAPAAQLSFSKGPYTTADQRDWLLNSATGNSAQKVSRVDLSDTFAFQGLEIYRDENGIIDWSKDSMLKLSTNKGYQVDASTAGVLLDVKPSSGNFTLSFVVRTDGSGDKDDNGLANLLYVGPLKGDANSNYLRFFRDGGSSQTRFKAGNKDSSTVLNINNVFGKNAAAEHLITLVFSEDGTKLTAYVDGKKEGSGVYEGTVSLDDLNIVINGIENNYTGAAIYIDDFALYNCSLTETQVGYLNGGIGSETATTLLGKTLGSINKINSSFGTNATLHLYQPGWYYITGSGDTEHYQKVGTGKRLIGLHGTQGGGFSVVDEASGFTYTNTTSDTPVKFFVYNNELRCFYAEGSNLNVKNSAVYELDDNNYVRTEALQRALGLFVTKLDEYSPMARISAVRFSANSFTDDEMLLLNWTDDPKVSTGMLALEYGADGGKGTSTGATDGQYNYGLTGGTRTARGLKAYIDKLQADDTPKDKDGKPVEGEVPKYIIIFTDGADDSLKESDNGDTARGYANDLKVAGYTIYTVLLDGSAMNKDDYDTAKEFLISLSGNKDTVQEKEKEEYFYSLKKAKSDSKYQGLNNDTDILTNVFADDILNEITNPLSGYTVQDYIDPRFDLVDQYGIVWHLNAGGSVEKHTADGLMIPDLVDTEAMDEDGNIIGAIFELSDSSDEIAQSPSLCYDREKDLYYLKWVDQNIPGSTVGATRLAVWNARITIRAKDDFIGGNAVLTNGTEENMNYVYSQALAVEDRNSGTDNAKPEPGSTEPNPALSKGFPRISVNVLPPSENVHLDQIIFMGEKLDKNDIAANLIEAAYEKSEGLERLYWEYIGRFVRYFKWLKANDPDAIDNLHEMNRLGGYIDPDDQDSLETGHMKIISNRIYDMIQNDELSIETLSQLLIKDSTIIESDGTVNQERYLYLPYIYLPDDPEEPTNSTGTDEHLWDVIGYLYFHVSDTDGATYPPYPTDDGGITKDTRTRMSKLTVSFAVRNPDVRAEWNNGQMIQENAYQWDPDYKSAVGEATNEDEPIFIRGDFTSYIVGGEMALQALVSDEAAAELQRTGAVINYTADLYWNGNKIGTFTAKIDAASLDASKTVNAAITYNDFGGYLMNQYGLPMGEYTLENGRGWNVPEKFAFSTIELIDDAAEYKASLFSRGTDNNTPQKYTAYVNGDSFLLGDEAFATTDKAYTSFRFGLFRVELAEAPANSLTISKIIKGEAAEANEKEYTFTVAGSADDIAGETYMLNDGRNITFDADGKATVTVMGGSSVTIIKLPAGTYEVKENRSEAEIDGYALTVAGEGSVAITDANGGNIKITNTYTRPRYGTLTVSKTVVGSAGEKDREFHFIAMIGGDTYEFTLSDGESWTSEGYNAGTQYAVMELEANQDGYTTAVSGDVSGSIWGDRNVTVSFTNKRDAKVEDIPKTGDDSNITMWLALLTMAGMGFLLIKRRKSAS